MEDPVEQAITFPQEGEVLLTNNAKPFIILKEKEGEGITGVVHLVMLASNDYIPKGLGKWRGQRSDLERDFPPQPGRWIFTPEKGEILAIKVTRPVNTRPSPEILITQERANLIRCNGLFREESSTIARPVKLSGYGIDETYIPYLILEGFLEPFVNLEQYLQKMGGKLSEKEAIEIAWKLCQIMGVIHQQGIIYNDINGDKLDNVFWDPKSGRVRLIDWANSIDTHREDNFFGVRSNVSPGNDRGGLGELLFTLITGGRIPDRMRLTSDLHKSKEDYERSLSEMNQFTREIIRKACYGANKSESYDRFAIESTGQMLTDLQTAYQTLT